MMPGLFDEQFLLKKLDQKVDPLARLNSIVDWQIVLPIIEKALGRDNASSAGRKPYPTLFMFKILIRGDRALPVERPPRASFRLPLRKRVRAGLHHHPALQGGLD